MEQNTFRSLIKYYLSCLDEEDAAGLQLKKDDEAKTYIYFSEGGKEVLFSDNLPKLEFSISDNRQKEFIEHRAPNPDNLVPLYYGFPIIEGKNGIFSPLFFTKVAAKYSKQNTLQILPQGKSLTVNRKHFVEKFSAEKTQQICEELQGKFGSFEDRLKAVAEHIGDKWDKRPVIFRANVNSSSNNLRYDLNFLLNNYDSTKETALKYFIDAEEKTTQKDSSQTIQSSILEIGLLNSQQEGAIAKGLTEPLSAVTGPPGTGKTQVVTALIASAVYNNETVLFASNNNMPVDGVYGRLGLSAGENGNWLMRLGRMKVDGGKTKTELCKETISSLLELVNTHDLSNISLDKDRKELDRKASEINNARASLKKAQRIQNQISKLHNEEKKIKQILPENWIEQFSDTDPVELDQAGLNKLRKHSVAGCWIWLRRKLFGVEQFTAKQNILLTKLCGDNKSLSEYEGWLLVDETWNKAIARARRTARYLQNHQSWVLRVQKRRRLEEKLTQHSSMADIIDLKNQKSKISKQLFENWWLNNIHGSEKDALEAFRSYFKDIDDFESGRHRRLEKSIRALKRFFPVWITTNQSAGATMPPQASLFDLVIIDEASQCNIPSIIPLLYRAKRAVIIGDPEQFRHITSLTNTEEQKIVEKLIVDEEIADEWSFRRRSAFDRAFASTNIVTFLNQHYRCHPEIIEFSNQNFYDGKLVEQVPLSQFQKLPIKKNGLIWHNIVGHLGKTDQGAWNPKERDKIIQMYNSWFKDGLFKNKEITYGIITPFRKQVSEIKQAIKKYSWYTSNQDRFTIGTAHTFQGSECDVLVFSPVVANGMAKYLANFAAQRDLTNVAITRAKKLLYIVGDLHACQTVSSDTPLHQLATYAERIQKQKSPPMNVAEEAMAKILDESKFSYLPQYEIGEYRLDFMFNSPSGERYDIEVDGNIHFTSENVQHDERRDAFVESKGLKIIRFTAQDVMNRPELIKERLMRT
jgi:very-short-patch-repair endonuclease